MFNMSDYNENVIVCEYVWRKNQEQNLGLEDAYDIQRVANLYADKLQLDYGELVEKDLELFKIVRKYIASEQFHKNGYRSFDDAKNRLYYDEVTNRNGGYGYNEAYDDLGLDERENGFNL